ncbi:DUF1772 domain-containing protein [Pseudonocardia sp.]|uniref:anthrone oxygenase family protein n=1 Tax=Pseudonocardia sp. TaxID=60912 RepID=UPI003D0EB537
MTFTGVVIGIMVVGSALVAGVMLAFSTAVMPGLARRPAAEGAAAMQEVNRVILNPVFLGVYLLTAVASVALLIVGTWPERIGALLYLLGVFVVTSVVNVPLNNRLDAGDPASAQGAQLWAHYLRRWTAWNHVRTVAGTGAAVLAFL